MLNLSGKKRTGVSQHCLENKSVTMTASELSQKKNVVTEIQQLRQDALNNIQK